MPRTFTPSIEIARKLLASNEPWLLFVEVELRVRGPEGQQRYWRLVRDTQHRVAASRVWQRSGLAITLPPEDVTGGTGDITITLPNASQIPAAYVLVDRDVLGCVVHLQWAHASSLSTFDPQLRWTARIAKVTLTEKTAVFVAKQRLPLSKGPRLRFTRSKFPQLVSRGFGR